MAAKKFKYEEFLPVYQQVLKDVVEGTYDDILEGVRVFDKEGNGTVMGAEIRHVLRTLGEKLTPNEISSVMDGQEDMNGSLNIETFCKYLIDGKKEEK
uniref:Myosin light chain 3, skeletal muscle isoform n=1 Tax=Phallusia mammillata TaxID=59560 RepID=A0A6F9DMA1_9ASCI|nr:myosin light chain 3, skeletal muscle isoform [Phallusia mammillata]